MARAAILQEGDQILFKPGAAGRKPWRQGNYMGQVPNQPGVVKVHLDGDPYAVCVSSLQVTKSPKNRSKNMPGTKTAPGPSARELRRTAKGLGIEGWEEMGRDDLIAAIESVERKNSKSKKSSAKKTASKRTAPDPEPDEDDEDDEQEDEDADEEDEDAPPAKAKKSSAKKPVKKTSARAARGQQSSGKTSAKKASSKRAADEDETEVAENGNPFKADTNMWHFTEELLKGGKRSAMVKRLKKKIELTSRDDRELDLDYELDRRLLITGQILEKEHGFTKTKEGRGADATIQVFPPE